MTDPIRIRLPSPEYQPGANGDAPKRRGSWTKWSLLTAVIVVIVYAVIVRPLTRSAAATRAGIGPGATPVAAETVKTADLNVRIVALGTVTPVYTVTVHSRVDGELQKVFFQEGTTVEAGAPLADLDARPFEVQKMQAEAQLAKDSALLDDARLDLVRYQNLLAQDSVAKQQVDTQASLVRQYEAATKVDQAQVASAALQLTYTHIIAPIAGRIGLRTVDQGNIVHAADATGIAVITQLHPITVLFSIPQDSVRKVMKNITSDGGLVVEAFDQDGRTQLATGKLVTVDNEIDPNTGTVKLRAEFANTDDSLFPNQFVNIQLLVDQLKGATVVPTAAVQRGTAGNYVYIVSEKQSVSVRSVETGPSEHSSIAITKGLAPGEVVVVDGVDKLHEGSTVELISHSTLEPTANVNKAGTTADKRGRSSK